MSTKGHCNCGSVKLILNELPSSCILCYCGNCRRAGGLCSANYNMAVSNISLQDDSGALRTYEDHNTTSGNVQHVSRVHVPKLLRLQMLNLNRENSVEIADGIMHLLKIPERLSDTFFYLEVFTEQKPAWLRALTN
ncbi:hypothetical protein BGW36DRAFT_375292 [Talaromyces proteolyticus]|uniref:CENP-V/GFA domain-containing protein n=1 Tax=Talaromyces proteolyticus TaxID=1131652 RepID=A0AAD4KZY7_9EURO|nr:uncharacterized protein BGW36DRAFT_375292 [Talaromyces proteolyticus]KAH8700950.1 hypothetical protein BGW36DRAFT_375292 [Talaromyces proteolyticus]